MHVKLNFFAKKDLGKGRIFLVVMLWSAIIAFIVIKVFWVEYTTNPRFYIYKDLFARYDAPAPQLLDLLILMVASVGLSFLMSTPKDLIYGFIASLFLSFFTGVVYVFLYIWYILDFGVLFSGWLYDWEIALFLAVLNIFRIMFPSVVTTCVVGAVIGFFVREHAT